MNALLVSTPSHENQPTMSSLEISELTGKQHSHVKRDIKKIFSEIGERCPKMDSFKNSRNQTVKCYVLNKEQSLLVVSGYNANLRFKIIRRWSELENVVEKIALKESLDCQLLAIDYCKKMLNFNEASTLQLVHKAMRDNNLSTAALPEYVESKDVMFSATDLLKKINADITTQAFNKLMVKAGYLEIKERTKANKKETKKFKALTGPGLYYGENVTAPQNKLEVTPRYFESKFDELYDKILVFA